MPRTYLSRDEKGTHLKTSADDSGGMKAESFLLGNTDFDAQSNPITAFNFVLEVEALYFLALKSVKAFTKENEFEYIREGGVNDYVHLKRKPISKPFTFQVERYIGTDRFLDPLALGTELILPLVLYVYRHQTRQGLSKGTGGEAYPARMYVFTGCTVMSKDYGELDAERSGLVTETTTISYRELVVVTNPFDSIAEKPEWTFSGNKQTDGTYKTKYAAFAKNDDTGSGTYAFKMTTDKYGNKVVARKESDKEQRPAWDGTSGAKPKYAKQSSPDENNKTYEEKEVAGRKQIVRTDNSDYNRAQYELKKDGSKPKYATEAYVDQNAADKIYDDVVTDGVAHKTRIDNEPLVNKPAWQFSDGVKPKHAIEAYIDQNAADKIYDDIVKDGIKRKTRVDHEPLVNKPAWEGYNGAKTRHAQQSAPDKNNTVYTVTNKDGVPIVKRTDSSQFNRPQYELKKDKTKQKYSEVAFADQEAGSPIYKVNGGKVTRNDKGDLNRKQYEMRKDRAKTKYAQKSPTDKEKPVARPQYNMSEDMEKAKYAKTSPRDAETAQARPQYEMSVDMETPKYAKISPTDSEKAKVRTPYTMSKDGAKVKYARKSPKDSKKNKPMPQYEMRKDMETPKYAKVSPTDSEKAVDRAPYKMSIDGAKNKYAKRSPKDSEKPEPVLWPPTRRAMMAEALKK